MSETIKTWLAIIVISIGVLMLCDWMDRPVPTECITQIHDGAGISHEFIGRIKFICPVEDGC